MPIQYQPPAGTVTSVTATDPVVITPDPTTTTGDISLNATTADIPDSTDRRYVTDSLDIAFTNASESTLIGRLEGAGDGEVGQIILGSTIIMVGDTLNVDPSSVVGGIAGEIQFNESGVFGGIVSTFTDGSNLFLKTPIISDDFTTGVTLTDALAAGYDSLLFQSNVLNTGTVFSIVPNGTVASFPTGTAWLSTDTFADDTNYESVGIAAKGSGNSYHLIYTNAAGSATRHALDLEANASFGAAPQLVIGTDGGVSIGTGTAAGDNNLLVDGTINGSNLSGTNTGDQTLPAIASTSSVLKGDGAGNAVAAVADTDYAPALVVQNVGNANAVITAGVTIVRLTAILTVTRTLTLPAANLYGPGTSIVITDVVGGASLTDKIRVQRAGSDTINGLTTTYQVLLGPYESATLYSDGTSNWQVANVDGSLVSGNVTGADAVVKSNTPTITSPVFSGGFSISGVSSSGTGKIMKLVSPSTLYRPTTETYAAPGTSGNIMTSDGTDWTSVANAAVPTARVLTINGDAQDLSADRSWTVTPDTAADYAWTGDHTFASELTIAQTPNGDFTIADGFSMIVPSLYNLPTTTALTINGTGILMVA